MVLSQLLKQWGDEGLEAHVRKTQLEYWRRASAVHEAAKKVRGVPDRSEATHWLGSSVTLCSQGFVMPCTQDSSATDSWNGVRVRPLPCGINRPTNTGTRVPIRSALFSFNRIYPGYTRARHKFALNCRFMLLPRPCSAFFDS